MIEDTDWAALEHAYGPAQDTPLRLIQLLDDDPDVQASALGQRDMSVLRQESLYSPTALAAVFIAAILGGPRILARVWWRNSQYLWIKSVRWLLRSFHPSACRVADAAGA
ncbi:hypothetical protein AB0O85_42245, partial [Streptomyces sp. NPDC086182]